MASWKKIIVSGSDAELNELSLDTQLTVGGNQQITTDQSTTFLTGSFSGSFQGDGSGLTGIPAENIILSNLTEGAGISAFTYDGAAAVTVAVSGAAELSDNTITKWNDTDGKFVNSSLVDNGTAITGTTSLQLTGANTTLTGSFTGSFVGDGSGLTGLATTLSGSTDSGDFEVDLLTQNLTVQGTNSEIEVSGTGQTITIGLPNDVTVAGNLTVNGEGVTVTGDLEVNGGDINSSATTFNLFNSTVSTINFGGDATTVNIGSAASTTTINDDLVVVGDLTVNGDLAYLNVTNLYVEDRFVLLNSGSTSGDGGIIVQSGSSDQGKAFFYDETENRWGYADGILGTATSATPDAFAVMVIENDGEGDEVYQKTGNLRVDTSGDIFIYS
jgi:phage baseplate assembly protein gpV